MTDDERIERIAQGFRNGLLANRELIPDLPDDEEVLRTLGYSTCYKVVQNLREAEQVGAWKERRRR